MLLMFNKNKLYATFSISGQYVIQYPGMYAYSASKHAVTVMTEGLRRELRDLKTNIRVTVITLLLVSIPG
jgi:NADP-dependent 3-hydroxy acid dehydrogenase YdfG